MNPEQLIDLALKLGASHAEVYQSSSLSYPVFFEANRLKQLESSQSEGIALRVWQKGCPGLAVSYGEVSPDILVEKALSLCSLNPPETPEFSEPRTAIYPPQGKTFTGETFVEMGKNAIETIRESYADVLCSAEFTGETNTTLLMNSEGLHCEYTETSMSYYLGVEWIRGDDFLGIYEGEYSQDTLNLETLLKILLKRLEWAQNNVDPLVGKVPIIFTANAATLLWGTVADALNGKRVLEKSSPWSDKLNQQIISSQLSLSQDPTLKPYAIPFDDEGTPTQSYSLIKEGYLQQFYSDRKTARHLNLSSSGNGFRSELGNYPTPSLVNLIIHPGKGNLDTLIAKIDQGLVIDQILGGGADISGDFSVNIDLGYRIEKGQIIGRIKDTMVTGNIYTALEKILFLGEERRWNSSCYTPDIAIHELSVVR